MRADEEKKIFFEGFDKLGEPGVEAKLEEGIYQSRVALAAREWLNTLRFNRAETQRKSDLKYIRLTAQASWALAGITFVLVAITSLGVYLQKEDNLQQRENAKSLLGMQISVELDKQFDSPEMRQARRRLANQLLNNKEVTEFRILDFFDKLAMYTNQKIINKDDAEQSYSYWILRYWPAIKTTVEDFRKQENDPSFYQEVEELYGVLLASAVKDGASVSNEQVLRFLKEEATLPQ